MVEKAIEPRRALTAPWRPRCNGEGMGHGSHHSPASRLRRTSAAAQLIHASVRMDPIPRAHSRSRVVQRRVRATERAGRTRPLSRSDATRQTVGGVWSRVEHPAHSRRTRRSTGMSHASDEKGGGRERRTKERSHFVSSQRSAAPPSSPAFSSHSVSGPSATAPSTTLNGQHVAPHLNTTVGATRIRRTRTLHQSPPSQLFHTHRRRLCLSPFLSAHDAG